MFSFKTAGYLEQILMIVSFVSNKCKRTSNCACTAGGGHTPACSKSRLSGSNKNGDHVISMTPIIPEAQQTQKSSPPAKRAAVRCVAPRCSVTPCGARLWSHERGGAGPASEAQRSFVEGAAHQLFAG